MKACPHTCGLFYSMLNYRVSKSHGLCKGGIKMIDPEVLSKVRIFLGEEGVIIPKGPIKEFYSQLLKLSGFGIGGLLTFWCLHKKARG